MGRRVAPCAAAACGVQQVKQGGKSMEKTVEVSSTVAVVVAFLSPFILIGAIVIGYTAAWYFEPPADPRIVDEIRVQMGKLREQMILDTIKRVDISDCKLRRWEMSAEFVPFAVVIGENCGKKKK